MVSSTVTTETGQPRSPLLVHETQSPVQEAEKGPNRESWRKTVYVCICAASCVLVANIVLLIWARQTGTSSEYGATTVLMGGCGRSRAATIWPELGINILSTVLLSASNYCSQLLSTPTRQDIDNAHANGQWLDIGVPSMRNLIRVPRWRALLWAILFLSSIPLHLVYNSVLFRGEAEVSYRASIVTEDFLTGAWWNTTRVTDGDGPTLQLLKQMQKSAIVGNLTRLDNKNCLEIYFATTSLTEWRNVLLVTSSADNDSMVEDNVYLSSGYANCDYSSDSQSCVRSRIADDKTKWTIINYKTCEFGTKMRDCHELRPWNSAPIIYCLAEPFQPRCTVQVSLPLLAIVIASNVVKIGCFMATTLCCKFEPLGTVGDAIASFLEHPDDTTANMGPVCMATIKSKRSTRGKISVSVSLNRETRRWRSAAGKTRWILCVGLYGVALSTGFWNFLIIWLFKLPEKYNTTKTDFLVGFTLNFPNISNLLFVNTPQVIISFVYLFYNSIFTCMVLAHEYGGFASVRKPLRVSRPYGQQRTTLWLQLPYRYITPMMIAMAFLHWAVSRCLYLIQVTKYSAHGTVDTGSSIYGCGYSLTGILTALSIGATMMLTLVGISFRPLNPGMPVVGSCSLAISAACHPGKDERDAAALPVQYGVITGEEPDGLGRRRVGFSSRPVEPLVKNEYYI